MDVVWDPEKAKSDLKKHGVRFSDAEMVLSDPNALTKEDTDTEHEQRFVTVGMDSCGRILVAAYTYRGEDIRLISARPATKRERRSCEEEYDFQKAKRGAVVTQKGGRGSASASTTMSWRTSKKRRMSPNGLSDHDK